MQINEVIQQSTTDHTRAKKWIDKVYSKYPQVWQNNHIMTWGEGDDQQFAMFELIPSVSKRDAVEIKWFQAYPLRQGVGSRAIAELQQLAKEDGISLTLYPWDKGQVSQAKLTKFYKGQGFKPSRPGSKNMYWEPGELTESLSRIAYHYTGLPSALKILTSGEFQLSSTLGSVEQQYAPKGKPYFLSTTRSRHGGYHDIVGSSGVLFVLDGDWFNRNYISKPVDYWENRDPTKSHHRAHEAEDRVFSAEPAISIGGIVAAHVYVSPDANDAVNAWARKTLIAAKNLGIETHLYTDKKAWRNFDSRKEADVGILKGQEQTGGYVSRHRGYLMPWVELLQAKDNSQLGKKAQNLRYNLQYTYDKQSAVQGLANDLSNARKPDSGPDRGHAVKIIKYMQQNGLSSVAELVDALATKWKSQK